MTVYEIMRTVGPSQEMEADFYERKAVVRIPNPPAGAEEDVHPIP